MDLCGAFELPAAAGVGDGGRAAAGAVAGDGDVVMAAAGSLREAEALSQYLGASMQLQPAAPSAFSGLAAAGDSSSTTTSWPLTAAAAAGGVSRVCWQQRQH
jgi:hypothetical protein